MVPRKWSSRGTATGDNTGTSSSDFYWSTRQLFHLHWTELTLDPLGNLAWTTALGQLTGLNNRFHLGLKGFAKCTLPSINMASYNPAWASWSNTLAKVPVMFDQLLLQPSAPRTHKKSKPREYSWLPISVRSGIPRRASRRMAMSTMYRGSI